jgi:hypothetical protein
MTAYQKAVLDAAEFMFKGWETGSDRYYPAQQIGTIAGYLGVDIEQVKKDVRAEFDKLVDKHTD